MSGNLSNTEYYLLYRVVTLSFTIEHNLPCYTDLVEQTVSEGNCAQCFKKALHEATRLTRLHKKSHYEYLADLVNNRTKSAASPGELAAIKLDDSPNDDYTMLEWLQHHRSRHLPL